MDPAPPYFLVGPTVPPPERVSGKRDAGWPPAHLHSLHLSVSPGLYPATFLHGPGRRSQTPKAYTPRELQTLKVENKELG